MNGIQIKDDSLKAKLVVSSKAIKYSKLELTWRIGITVAIIGSIILQICS